MKLFTKILIANRGEIAVRVIRSARKLGIKTVTVYSEADKGSLHADFGDESYFIGPNDLSQSYLNIEKIICIAKKTNCEAIHPGYGFLSENHLFVEACEDAGLTFIGPTTKVMDIMGNKIKARDFVKKINVPMTPSIEGKPEQLIKAIENLHSSSLQFPLLIKAAAGGGGKGMRIVNNDKDINDAIEATSREALSYFGDGTIYIEQFIRNPRHIEIQIIGDNHGNLVHLFERECSLQRRYQKVVEESPSPTLNDEVRKKICGTAVKIGKAIGYNNAGTIEFLVDDNLKYYFLEMNTRVQVEHPVTELVTGIDIVREQILVAAGNNLSFTQDEIKQNGHAIECRIYAEDPENDFMPSPGKMTYYKEPKGKDIRVDGAYKCMNDSQTADLKSYIVHSFYDPMISKLIVWGTDRESARKRMQEALRDYTIHGVKHNISFLLTLLKNESYINNNISTKFCEDHMEEILLSIQNTKKEIQSSYIPLLSYLIFSLNQNFLTANNKQRTTSIWSEIGFWRDIMKFEIEFDDNNTKVSLNKKFKNLYEFNISDSDYNAELLNIKDGKIELTINGEEFISYISTNSAGTSTVSFDGYIFIAKRKDLLVHEDIFSGTTSGKDEDFNHILSPIPGKVIKINFKEGDSILKGDILIVVEAMKMENNLLSHKDAVISKINVKVGDMVDNQIQLIELKD